MSRATSPLRALLCRRAVLSRVLNDIPPAQPNHTGLFYNAKYR